MHSADVLGKRCSHGLSGERAPIATLSVEGFVAEPVHELDEDPRAVAEVETHFCRRWREAVSGKRRGHHFENEILIRPAREIIDIMKTGNEELSEAGLRCFDLQS